MARAAGRGAARRAALARAHELLELVEVLEPLALLHRRVQRHGGQLEQRQQRAQPPDARDRVGEHDAAPRPQRTEQGEQNRFLVCSDAGELALLERLDGELLAREVDRVHRAVEAQLVEQPQHRRVLPAARHRRHVGGRRGRRAPLLAALAAALALGRGRGAALAPELGG